MKQMFVHRVKWQTLILTINSKIFSQITGSYLSITDLHCRTISNNKIMWVISSKVKGSAFFFNINLHCKWNCIEHLSCNSILASALINHHVLLVKIFHMSYMKCVYSVARMQVCLVEFIKPSSCVFEIASFVLFRCPRL